MGTTRAYRPNGVIGMYGLTRATTTLLFAAAAGLVIWIATQIDNGHTSGYWARVGLVAGAGLLMAMSQVVGGWTKWGRPRVSAAVLLTAFVPVAIASLWVVLAGEPGSGWFHEHVLSWSSDIHITGLVQDLLYYMPVLAFGSGLVFGFAFDTAGPVSREPVPTGRGERDSPRPKTRSCDGGRERCRRASHCRPRHRDDSGGRARRWRDGPRTAVAQPQAQGSAREQLVPIPGSCRSRR